MQVTTAFLTLGITAAMAWELPSKPINFDETFGNSIQMEKLSKIDNRIDQNKFTNHAIQYQSTISKPTNIYYTNIPSYKISSPYYTNANSHQQYSNNKSNKMQYYLSYADKVMNELKYMHRNLPSNQPMDRIDIKNIANKYV